jgi:hypothetical protein
MGKGMEKRGREYIAKELSFQIFLQPVGKRGGLGGRGSWLRRSGPRRDGFGGHHFNAIVEGGGEEEEGRRMVMMRKRIGSM